MRYNQTSTQVANYEKLPLFQAYLMADTDTIWHSSGEAVVPIAVWIYAIPELGNFFKQ